MKKNKDNVKFQVWCGTYFYNLVITDKKGRAAEAAPAPTSGSDGAEMKQACWYELH